MAETENLYAMFRNAAARYRKADALAAYRDGAWQTISHAELVDRVRHLSAGLHQLGVGAGDRVAIFSESRPEWTMVDLATLGVGAALVPVYPTVTAEQAAYILRDSGARIVVVSGQATLTKVLRQLPGLPDLERIVTIDDVSAPVSAPVSSLADLEAAGTEELRIDPQLPDRLAESIRESDLATIIYTSGTTGVPKGVILTHANILADIHGIFDAYQIFDSSDVALSFLPLSHVFERTAVYAYLYAGVSVYFARSIETMVEDLRLARPTVMTSVPRLYEKVYARINDMALAEGGVKAAIFRHMMRVGDRWARAKHAGEWVGPLTALQHKIGDLLIFRKWRAAFGGRVKFLLSGGAPLAPEIAYAFFAAGIEIFEGYGLTETSPVISFNWPGMHRIGTVGRPLASLDVKIAEDGEILVKGPSITSGYYHLPEETAAAFTEDGYFRTGDVGHADEKGFLVITDRKKDLIKTSGGKYVAPQPIETALKVSNLFTQVIVIGDRRKYCAALLVPNVPALRAALAERGLEVGERDLLANPRVEELCLRLVNELTPNLAGYEKLKRVALLPGELTVEAGELTPTLKVKRRVVEERYRYIIDRLYQESSEQAVAARTARR
jgi:long-chain acyl-CoA synthetase